MGIFKESKEWAEALNTYYQAILILYAVGLTIAALNRSTIIIGLAVILPLIAAWIGWVLRPIIEDRTQRYGFKIISDAVSYEIHSRNKYALTYETKLKAASDHLMVYPIGYHWSGEGAEGIPKLTTPGQQLMAPLPPHHTKATAYEAASISVEGKWHYWFVAFNPPIHKDGETTIAYSQEFQGTKKESEPYLYYYVRKPMEKLELSVKFPKNSAPDHVESSFIKINDFNRPYKMPGVVYDKHKQWATWTIHHPKRGYYRLDWHS